MNTETHRNTFNLRDNLAAYLNKALDADGRVFVEDSSLFADLAEDLIQEGWVVEEPQG